MRLPVSVIALLLSVASVTAQHATRYDESDGLSSCRIGGAVTDADGLLWIATANGLNCYDGYEFHHIMIRPGDKSTVNTNHIRDIVLTSDTTILCHTDDNIYEYSLVSHTFRDVAEGRRDSLMQLAGKPWRGTKDPQGNLWSATSEGLYRTASPHHPAHLLAGTENRHPRAFLKCGDSLMVAMRTNPSIAVYDSNLTPAAEHSREAAPYCLYRNSTGDIWVGAKPGGLYRLGEESISDDAVYDIKEDRHGRLWVTTFGNGIKCCPNPRDAHPTLVAALPGKKVRQLLLLPDDRLLAATTDGLVTAHIDAKTPQLTDIRVLRRDGNIASSLSSNAIMSLAADSKGNIFVCTESSGCDMTSAAALDSESPVFHHFNTANSSLTSDICRAMTPASDSTLIIAANDNVMLFNPLADSCITFNSSFWGDECRFTEAIPLVLDDGSWILGAEQGAFIATAHNIHSRGYVPPIVFTSWGANGRPGRFTPTALPDIIFPADSRNISVSFAAIDFTDNNGILYRTRVDGSPWTAADRSRRIDLFNLSPGRHTLEVQSTDRYGRWVDNVRRATIEIKPYWHETVAARIAFILLAVAAVCGITYICLYIRRVNRQRRELFEKYMALMKDSSGTPSAGLSPVESAQKPEVAALLGRVRHFIEENIGNSEASVDNMAAAAAVSRSTLNRHLRNSLGVSASQLLADARMQRAEQLLRHSTHNIADIADMCGYADHHYFRRVFTARHGCTPADYRATV